ncbi:MAG: carboxypeptidase regulatory-like domain-containing protein, partial [Fimbriimonadaceae bacterium]|nr:carboxypeptidase regulatory-like domain-containing protein [Fimbriimonadaceae bacterium]
MNESTTQRAAASTRVLALVAAGAIAAGLLAFGITEEVPVGGIEGKVMLKENGRTLKGVEVYLSPTEEDQNESARRYRLESDEKGRFFIRNMPSGDYTITANAKAHSFDAERVTIGEGKPTVVELLLKPTEPYLNLNASQKVFLPKEQPSFQIDGFLANEKLGIDVYRLNLTEIVKKGGVTSLLQAFSRYANSREDPAKYGTKVRHLDHKIVKQDAEGVFV